MTQYSFTSKTLFKCVCSFKFIATHLAVIASDGNTDTEISGHFLKGLIKGSVTEKLNMLIERGIIEILESIKTWKMLTFTLKACRTSSKK